ncbi:hypothetical protein DF185_20075 [Marinifilum breve]|uniref:Outer membrane protein beta-barrel domain-containing protein n=1 Tax=Marinifilum breve TaxID=2184082 RepID=A0A2V3ZT98_9BACT|nr:carboxypeptidase-like regulatory domain-containing protein [Marinifilum breve]PXX96939.1 hypothetical protein DF185_20075 [Marinifilum breve]
MKPILLVILIALMHSNLLAQMTICGKISDNNNTAIPGSSIFVKDSYVGSISNRDGKFSIKIPQNLQSSTLCISSIGYQTQEILIRKIQSPMQVRLQQDTCDLAEVLVMPKDTLLALLRRAYGKIKDNYPDFDTRMKGLYRETYYNPKKEEYLYFGEAQLDVFKTSYKTKTEGQVKIVKSRMNKHPLYDSLATVMWYGGVHSPVNGDDVKIKAHYLSPNGLKDFDYSIYKDVLDAKPVYRIDFKPKENINFSYAGKFYLDINSLAYLYIEGIYTKYGSLQRSKELSDKKLNALNRKFIVKYSNWNGKYYLSYMSDEEKLYSEKLRSELIQFDEFLVTDIQTQNVQPIPFIEQSEYRDVFYLNAENVAESTWKSEQVILPDSSLSQLIEYDANKAQDLLNKQYELPKKYRFKQKLFEVITRMYFDMNFEYTAGENINNARVQFSPSENQVFEKSKSSSDPYYTFGMKMGYKLNSHWDVNFETQESVGKNFSNLNSIGFAYETPIINRGNQLLLIAGLNYYFANDGQHIGDFKSESDFRAGGKKIKADKIALFVGKKKQGISLDFGLKTRIHEFYSLFISGGYQMNISDKDRLFIKEKSGFFLTRKTTDVALSDSSIQYYENGVQTTKTSFDTKDFYLKAGIRFAF